MRPAVSRGRSGAQRQSSGLAASTSYRTSLAGNRPRPSPSPSPRPRVRVPTTSASAATASGSFDFDEDFKANQAKYILANGMVDYYEVLGVDDDADAAEVKQAYRALAKECHPDFLGEEGHNICILLNEAYDVLSDAAARAAYNVKLQQALEDDADNFTGELLSKWMPALKPKMAKNEDPAESRGVFVDEFTCIGCKQCIFHACATFRIEPEHGRSRVYAQWLDTEENIQAAIDSCPVDCIHWVDKAELPALEYVIQKVMTQRTNVGVMMAGQGATADVWAATARFLKERKRKEEEAARAARAYSPQQEKARREAAERLWQQQAGWFGTVIGRAMESMNETVYGPVGGAGGGDDSAVGNRKRTVKWTRRERSDYTSSYDSEDEPRSQRVEAVRVAPGYSVPPELALVPLSSRDDAPRRRP